MALPHLFVCPRCGAEAIRTRVWLPIPDGEPRLYKGQEFPLAVLCEAVYDGERCMTAMDQDLAGIGCDVFPGDFVIDVHDGVKEYKGRVSSLRELRTIERESEQHARDNPGVATPLVWRDLSQGRSNRAQNTLTGTAWEKGRSQRADPRTQRGRRISGGAYEGEGA